MATFDEQQITMISKKIKEQFGIDTTENHELLDHVACMIESEIHTGLSFEIALVNVLSSFSKAEIKTLNVSTYGFWSQLRNTRYAKKYSVIIGALLCLWIFGEYVSATLFNTPELGAIYGLISMVIIFMGLYKSTNHFSRFKSIETVSFWKLYRYQMKIVASSAIIVVLFLLPYLSFLNINFYGLYEGDQTIPPFRLSMAIIIGTFFGILLEGSMVSLLTTWLQKRKMQLS